MKSDLDCLSEQTNRTPTNLIDH